MRFKEIISEAVHDPVIDWAKFKLAMAAIATQRPGYGKIDGIVFLGLAGDPNSQSILNVKLKGPARIGVADPDSGKELGFDAGAPGSRGSFIAGEYYGNAYRHDTDPSDKGYEIRKEYQYNIIINQKHFNQATGEITTTTLVHEAQHRGFDIIMQIPEIINNVNSRTRKYVEHLNYRIDQIEIPEIKDNKDRETLAHLMIYSFEAPDQIGDGSSDEHIFRSKEEVKMFRIMYQDINSAAIAYVKRHPVPKGGLELLRKEVDRLTPDTVEITVKPDAQGKPVIIGKLSAEEIERRNKLIQGGADIDKSGNIIPKAGNTDKGGNSVKLAPVISQSPSVSNNDPTADPEKQPDPTDTVKNTNYKGSTGSQKLQQLNPSIKNVNLIYPGQKIKLPNGNTVTVKAGDTLDKIAARHNIKEDQLNRIKQLAGLR
jgi:LysM repeat protein